MAAVDKIRSLGVIGCAPIAFSGSSEGAEGFEELESRLHDTMSGEAYA